VTSGEMSILNTPFGFGAPQADAPSDQCKVVPTDAK
jgi:hypothetical protein